MGTIRALETLHRRNEAKNEDRVYVAAVVEKDGGGWMLALRWGRRGTKGNKRDYHYTSLSSARAAWQKKVDEQLSDHYVQVDWQRPEYRMRPMVQALGDQSGLAGQYAPAAVTQGPTQDATQATFVKKIWEYAQQGKSTKTIAHLMDVPVNEVNKLLLQLVKVARTQWEQQDRPPHHAIVGWEEVMPGGTPMCVMCKWPLNGAYHLEFIAHNRHAFKPRPNSSAVCYCGREAASLAHSAKPNVKPTTTPAADIAKAPAATAPATPVDVAGAAAAMTGAGGLTNEDLATAGVVVPNLESEAPTEPIAPAAPPAQRERPVRAPIVLPQRRRERMPRGGF